VYYEGALVFLAAYRTGSTSEWHNRRW